MQDAHNDRILYWPFVLAIVWPLAFAVVGSGSFLVMAFGAPIVLMGWLISGVAAVLISAVWIYERTWLRLLSTLVLPLALVVAGYNLEFIWRTGQIAGDNIYIFTSCGLFISERYRNQAAVSHVSCYLSVTDL